MNENICEYADPVAAALRAYASASKEAKCPICAGTESCDHSVKERLVADLDTPAPHPREGSE